MNSIKTSQVIFVNILVIFCLLLLGGLVHNTQSSLACPDWPLCYGQIFPKMEGGVLIEHSHRLLASTVGLLTILILVLNFKRKASPNIITISLIALALVVMQGILGGITVIYKLPTIVSTFHLGLSLIFLSVIIYLYHLMRIEEGQDSYQEVNFNTLTLRQLLISSTILVYLQILLGAFTRHSGAGVACGLNFEHAIQCFDTNYWVNTWWPSTIPAQVHVFHRYFALFVFLFHCFTVTQVATKIKVIRPYLVTSIVIFLFQIGLGIWTISSGIAVLPTTLHLGGAALILALLVKSNLVLSELADKNNFEHNILSDLFNLTKPKLTALVMATVFVGMVLAPGEIHFFKSVWSFTLILLVVMGAGMLNCYIERDIDKQMDRTKNRSLPAGRLSPDLAFVIGVFLTVVPIVLLYFQINPVTSYLTLLAALLYLLVYTPMKQKSEHAVFIGAIPGALPPILGFTSITGKIDMLSSAVYLIMLIWQIPHFFAISLFHFDDYGRAKILTFPNVRGTKFTRRNIFAFTLVLMATTFVPYIFGGASKVFFNVSLVLGFLFSLLSLRGIFTFNSDEKEKNWAHQYFFASIIYLPLVLLALIFFK